MYNEDKMNEDVFNLGIKALIRDKEGKILLLQVDHKQLIDEPNDYWDIPGGRIKRGESVKDTLKKEIEEETGLKTAGSVKPLAIVLSNIRIPKQMPDGKDVGLILSIYVCNILIPKKIILSKEHINCDWFTPKKAEKLLSYKYPKKLTEKFLEI